MELRRSLLQMRRYPVETALSFLILSGMFFGIAYGADAAFGNPQPAGQVATLTVLSFMGWMFCMNLLSGPAAEIEAESQSGTVEQLFTGGLSVQRILLARMSAGVVVTGAIVSGIVLLVGRIAEVELSAQALAAVALALVTAAGAGFVLAGVALLFKKTRALVLLATFGLMPVMIADGAAAWIGTSSATLLLPFVGPMGLAKAVVMDSTSWSWGAFCIALGASLAYFVIGLVLFGRMRLRAMRRATIGHY
ncbi:hypothetical protein [Novilysobacter selenitireducens]|uniref:ABC transporter permease n=1 Tax=Novilysobacter selenitireducens TaxID=2872639 RepID=A0ABS7T3U9_9GAMM|nr:hypothetical protein [Lysobacter selenitireducens]MBZ4038544.1 hypothetical protein [Lysobacter selenitireducens]